MNQASFSGLLLMEFMGWSHVSQTYLYDYLFIPFVPELSHNPVEAVSSLSFFMVLFL